MPCNLVRDATPGTKVHGTIVFRPPERRWPNVVFSMIRYTVAGFLLRLVAPKQSTLKIFELLAISFKRDAFRTAPSSSIGRARRRPACTATLMLPDWDHETLRRSIVNRSKSRRAPCFIFF